MSPALQSLITSPEGIITFCVGALLGVTVGVCIMAGIGHWEDRTRARIQREMAQRPRVRSEITAPESPLQRLVREAEQHERKSA